MTSLAFVSIAVLLTLLSHLVAGVTVDCSTVGSSYAISGDQSGTNIIIQKTCTDVQVSMTDLSNVGYISFGQNGGTCLLPSTLRCATEGSTSIAIANSVISRYIEFSGEVLGDGTNDWIIADSTIGALDMPSANILFSGSVNKLRTLSLNRVTLLAGAPGNFFATPRNMWFRGHLSFDRKPDAGLYIVDSNLTAIDGRSNNIFIDKTLKFGFGALIIGAKSGQGVLVRRSIFNVSTTTAPFNAYDFAINFGVQDSSSVGDNSGLDFEDVEFSAVASQKVAYNVYFGPTLNAPGPFSLINGTMISIGKSAANNIAFLKSLRGSLTLSKATLIANNTDGSSAAYASSNLFVADDVWNSVRINESTLKVISSTVSINLYIGNIVSKYLSGAASIVMNKGEWTATGGSRAQNFYVGGPVDFQAANVSFSNINFTATAVSSEGAAENLVFWGDPVTGAKPSLFPGITMSQGIWIAKAEAGRATNFLFYGQIRNSTIEILDCAWIAEGLNASSLTGAAVLSAIDLVSSRFTVTAQNEVGGLWRLPAFSTTNVSAVNFSVKDVVATLAPGVGNPAYVLHADTIWNMFVDASRIVFQNVTVNNTNPVAAFYPLNVRLDATSALSLDSSSFNGYAIDRGVAIPWPAPETGCFFRCLEFNGKQRTGNEMHSAFSWQCSGSAATLNEDCLATKCPKHYLTISTNHYTPVWNVERNGIGYYLWKAKPTSVEGVQLTQYLICVNLTSFRVVCQKDVPHSSANGPYYYSYEAHWHGTSSTIYFLLSDTLGTFIGKMILDFPSQVTWIDPKPTFLSKDAVIPSNPQMGWNNRQRDRGHLLLGNVYYIVDQTTLHRYNVLTETFDLTKNCSLSVSGYTANMWSYKNGLYVMELCCGSSGSCFSCGRDKLIHVDLITFQQKQVINPQCTSSCSMLFDGGLFFYNDAMYATAVYRSRSEPYSLHKAELWRYVVNATGMWNFDAVLNIYGMNMIGHIFQVGPIAYIVEAQSVIKVDVEKFLYIGNVGWPTFASHIAAFSSYQVNKKATALQYDGNLYIAVESTPGTIIRIPNENEQHSTVENIANYTLKDTILCGEYTGRFINLTSMCLFAVASNESVITVEIENVTFSNGAELWIHGGNMLSSETQKISINVEIRNVKFSQGFFVLDRVEFFSSPDSYAKLLISDFSYGAKVAFKPESVFHCTNNLAVCYPERDYYFQLRTVGYRDYLFLAINRNNLYPFWSALSFYGREAPIVTGVNSAITISNSSIFIDANDFWSRNSNGAILSGISFAPHTGGRIEDGASILFTNISIRMISESAGSSIYHIPPKGVGRMFAINYFPSKLIRNGSQLVFQDFNVELDGTVSEVIHLELQCCVAPILISEGSLVSFERFTMRTSTYNGKFLGMGTDSDSIFTVRLASVLRLVDWNGTEDNGYGLTIPSNTKPTPGTGLVQFFYGIDFSRRRFDILEGSSFLIKNISMTVYSYKQVRGVSTPGILRVENTSTFSLIDVTVVAWLYQAGTGTAATYGVGIEIFGVQLSHRSLFDVTRCTLTPQFSRGVLANGDEACGFRWTFPHYPSSSNGRRNINLFPLGKYLSAYIGANSMVSFRYNFIRCPKMGYLGSESQRVAFVGPTAEILLKSNVFYYGHYTGFGHPFRFEIDAALFQNPEGTSVTILDNRFEKPQSNSLSLHPMIEIYQDKVELPLKRFFMHCNRWINESVKSSLPSSFVFPAVTWSNVTIYNLTSVEVRACSDQESAGPICESTSCFPAQEQPKTTPLRNSVTDPGLSLSFTPTNTYLWPPNAFPTGEFPPTKLCQCECLPRQPQANAVDDQCFYTQPAVPFLFFNPDISNAVKGICAAANSSLYEIVNVSAAQQELAAGLTAPTIINTKCAFRAIMHHSLIGNQGAVMVNITQMVEASFSIFGNSVPNISFYAKRGAFGNFVSSNRTGEDVYLPDNAVVVHIYNNDIIRGGELWIFGTNEHHPHILVYIVIEDNRVSSGGKIIFDRVKLIGRQGKNVSSVDMRVMELDSILSTIETSGIEIVNNTFSHDLDDISLSTDVIAFPENRLKYLPLQEGTEPFPATIRSWESPIERKQVWSALYFLKSFSLSNYSQCWIHLNRISVFAKSEMPSTKQVTGIAFVDLDLQLEEFSRLQITHQHIDLKGSNNVTNLIGVLLQIQNSYVTQQSEILVAQNNVSVSLEGDYVAPKMVSGIMIIVSRKLVLSRLSLLRLRHNRVSISFDASSPYRYGVSFTTVALTDFGGEIMSLPMVSIQKYSRADISKNLIYFNTSVTELNCGIFVGVSANLVSSASGSFQSISNPGFLALDHSWIFIRENNVSIEFALPPLANSSTSCPTVAGLMISSVGALLHSAVLVEQNEVSLFSLSFAPLPSSGCHHVYAAILSAVTNFTHATTKVGTTDYNDELLSGALTSLFPAVSVRDHSAFYFLKNVLSISTALLASVVDDVAGVFICGSTSIQKTSSVFFKSLVVRITASRLPACAVAAMKTNAQLVINDGSLLHVLNNDFIFLSLLPPSATNRKTQQLFVLKQVGGMHGVWIVQKHSSLILEGNIVPGIPAFSSSVTPLSSRVFGPGIIHVSGMHGGAVFAIIGNTFNSSQVGNVSEIQLINGISGTSWQWKFIVADNYFPLVAEGNSVNQSYAAVFRVTPSPIGNIPNFIFRCNRLSSNRTEFPSHQHVLFFVFVMKVYDGVLLLPCLSCHPVVDCFGRFRASDTIIPKRSLQSLLMRPIQSSVQKSETMEVQAGTSLFGCSDCACNGMDALFGIGIDSRCFPYFPKSFLPAPFFYIENITKAEEVDTGFFRISPTVPVPTVTKTIAPTLPPVSEPPTLEVGQNETPAQTSFAQKTPPPTPLPSGQTYEPTPEPTPLPSGETWSPTSAPTFAPTPIPTPLPSGETWAPTPAPTLPFGGVESTTAVPPHVLNVTLPSKAPKVYRETTVAATLFMSSAMAWVSRHSGAASSFSPSFGGFIQRTNLISRSRECAFAPELESPEFFQLILPFGETIITEYFNGAFLTVTVLCAFRLVIFGMCHSTWCLHVLKTSFAIDIEGMKRDRRDKRRAAGLVSSSSEDEDADGKAAEALQKKTPSTSPNRVGTEFVGLGNTVYERSGQAASTSALPAKKQRKIPLARKIEVASNLEATAISFYGPAISEACSLILVWSESIAQQLLAFLMLTALLPIAFWQSWAVLKLRLVMTLEPDEISGTMKPTWSRLPSEDEEQIADGPILTVPDTGAAERKKKEVGEDIAVTVPTKSKEQQEPDKAPGLSTFHQLSAACFSFDNKDEAPNAKVEFPVFPSLQRYAPYYDGARETKPIAMLLYFTEESTFSLILGATVGMNPQSSCHIQSIVVLSLSLLHAVFVLALRPYFSRIDRIMSYFTTIGQVLQAGLSVVLVVTIQTEAAATIQLALLVLEGFLTWGFFLQLAAVSVWKLFRFLKRHRERQSKKAQDRKRKQEDDNDEKSKPLLVSEEAVLPSAAKANPLRQKKAAKKHEWFSGNSKIVEVSPERLGLERPAAFKR